MANPQKENGFTPIVNGLFEKIYRSNFTLREIKIIFAVIRYTDGFNRNAAELSLRFLSQATAIKYRHTQNTVANLVSKNVLLIETQALGMRSRQISLNKNYDLWNFSIDQKSITKNESDTTEKVSLTLTEKVSPETTEKVSKKENIKKTLNKTSIYDFSPPTELKEVKGFSEIWNSWVIHRKEIKKPLTPTVVTIQFNKLLAFKTKGLDVIEIIETAIEKGWQGFYELKKNNCFNDKLYSMTTPQQNLTWDLDNGRVILH